MPTVVIPGWQRSEPGHWQLWLAEQLVTAGRDVRHPALDVESPDLASWLVALRASLEGLPPGEFDVVAHSLGAVLWLHHVATAHECPRAGRVLLVAPPSPQTTIAEIAAFFPPPMDVDTVRRGADGTVLVGTSDDSYTPEGVAAAYGRPLKMPATIIEGGGHLNVDSGYGQWPAVLDWCGRDNLAFF